MLSNGTITLMGSGGEAVTVSTPLAPRHTGLALKTVPDGLDGFEVEHHFDEAWNHPPVHRGANRPIREMRLDLHTKGRDPQGQVDDLLDILGGPVDVVVTTARYGDRWVTGVVRHVSEVRWIGGSKITATRAELSVILEIPVTLWQSADQFEESTTGGWIELPSEGEQAFWPTIIITGSHEGVSVRLTADDSEQNLPYDPRGWQIETEPSRQGIHTVTGGHPYAGHVVSWASPVAVHDGIGRVEVVPTNPGSNFRVRVEWTPRSSRAW